MRLTASGQPELRTHELEVFFDGDCPLCQREITMLQRWDRQGRIRFTDIAAPTFDPAAIGVSYERLMAEIHARLPDGRLITGIEVFRRLYGAVGFAWLAAATRLPGFSHLFDLSYRVFARHRLRLTGRCEAGRCQVRPLPEAVRKA